MSSIQFIFESGKKSFLAVLVVNLFFFTNSKAFGAQAIKSSPTSVSVVSNSSTSDPIPSDALWVSLTGNDTSGTGSSANPFKSFAKAFTVLKSGGTLVIKDGTYSEAIGTSNSQPAAGKAGALTTIRAEKDGNVVVDLKGQDVPLLINQNFIRVVGIKFLNSSYNVGQLNGNNLEVKRCAFGNAGGGNYDVMVNAGGDDILIEDSWMWGRGKAGVEANSARPVLRRLVIRLDYYVRDLGFMGVILYGAFDAVIENVITLDFNTSPTTFDWKGGFRSRDMSDARTQKYFGTIALNLPYDGYRMSDSHYENVVAWNVKGRGLFEDSYKQGYTVKNATVGAAQSGGIITNTTSVLNSLMYQVTGNNTGGQYNHFYQSTIPNGASNAISTNPQMKYIVKVEEGSAGKGTGQGGADRGANVLYRYQNGVLTSQPLWPWPNENRIKKDFQTDFGLPGVTPKRGFAADGNGLTGKPITLTSYIWEYLGNPCPVDICK